MPRPRPLACAAVLALALVATPALAQRDLSKVELETTPLADGLHMIAGAGGNLGLLARGKDGLLIDDQFAELAPKIEAAIAAVTDQPLRFVLNTHWHGDHTGGNQNLAGKGVVIVAHDLVRARMSRDHRNPIFGWESQASPAEALPIVTFGDSLTFHLGGEDVVCFHVKHAHTDGDVMVWFPRSDVLHVGDCLFNGMYPVIDVSSGGHVDGMIAACEVALRLAGPSTRVIVGHGPLATRADLQAFHDMLVTASARVKKLVKQGKTVEQIVAMKPLADLDATWGKGFVTPELMLMQVVSSFGGR